MAFDKEYQKWVVPQKGLLVRFPRTKTPLPVNGAWVPWTGPEGRYWRRRVKDKTAIISTPPKEQSKSFKQSKGR